MKTIIAAVDFSPITERILAHAATLARAVHGRVVLVTALIPPVLPKEFAAAPNLGRVFIGTEKTVRRKLAALQQRLESEAVPTSSILLQGEPVRLIIEKASAARASYIVIGSHGHSAFFDLVVGSTTHGVLKHTSCAVVVIPAREIRPVRARRSSARA